MGKDAPKSFKSKDIQAMLDTQARFARPDQVTPYGSMTWNGDTVTTSLAPEQQEILDRQQLAQIMAGDTAIGRFGDLGSTRGDVEQATFQRALGLLNPELARHEGALQQRLANQGLPQTSRAYDREYGRFERGRNEALERLALSSVMAGGDAESQIIGNILALLTGAQPQTGAFFAPGQVDVLGAHGLAAGANQAKYATQAQLQGDIIGGLLGAGGTGVGAYAALGCSREIKYDLGEAPTVLDRLEGLDLRRWRYRDGDDQAEHVGPMAEDWRDQMGLGDGSTIHVIDALGVALQAVKELSQRVKKLEARA